MDIAYTHMGIHVLMFNKWILHGHLNPGNGFPYAWISMSMSISLEAHSVGVCVSFAILARSHDKESSRKMVNKSRNRPKIFP